MIFDGSLAIVARAGERWRERTGQRDDNRRRIAAGGIAAVDTPERIKARLDMLSAAAAQGAPPPVPAAATAALVESFGQERMLGRPDFLGVNFLELAVAVARFTGRINIRSRSGRTSGFGTGFMVSPQLLLTNNHVLPDRATAGFSEVEFDFQFDRNGRPLPVVPFRLLPETFFITDAALDFTLIAVSEVNETGVKARTYGWSQMIAQSGKALIGENVNIVQHPRGEAKQIVLRSNELVDMFDDFAHYVADTEPGSSGSPVYNDQWDLVALHHSGVPRLVDGKQVKKDGTPFVPGDDPNDLDWVANEGIRISSIVRFIEAQALSPAQARLREDLLTLAPMSPVEVAQAAQAGAVSAVPTGVAADTTAATAGVSWTIPLTVTVNIGTPVQGTAPAVSVAVTQAPVARAAVLDALPVAIAPAVPAPPASPELAKALAEAARAATRLYYDEVKDRAARTAYYDELEPLRAGLDPAALFAALSALVTQTHSTKPRYRPSVELYPWVDLQETPRPTVNSIYSGKPFDAATFIEEDFRSEAALAEAMAARPAAAPTEAAFDALEAQFPFNCEHVVPQSWFAKKEPMRGDLHHLFACESDCNSFRSNIPYFDFPDFEEAIRSDCGKREENKFEPANGKGAVARATLYFLLRYPGEINATRTEYAADRLPLLLDWHKRFLPTRWELHRNAAIFAKQGNRNPLIDFPEWAEKVDFSRGLGA